MSTLCLRGGRVIDPANKVDRQADVVIADGKVTVLADGQAAPPGVKVIDVEGMWVTPGLIDMHVHLREP